MAIRVMHVVNSLAKGGLENGLVNLIQRMDSGAFEHIVCTLRGLGPNLERLPLDRVRVVTLDASGWSARVQTPALVRQIRAMQPDIVHSRNWSAVEAVFAARLAGGCRVVHSEHGFEEDAAKPEPWRRSLVRRSAFELAHRVVSVSWQARDVHAGRTGYRADKIQVIHNGVDGARFHPDDETRQRLRAELRLSKSDLCIGCVANLVPVKDHKTLLEAMRIFAGHHPASRLLLIGEGPERTRLQAIVDAEPELRERVVFLGLSNRVAELLRAMDVFVLPSVAEGICNSLLEALATGVAVIATTVGGNPEVVEDGESGLLFRAGDAAGLANHLAALAASPDRRARLATGGIRRAQHEFSIDSMVQNYEQLYGSLRSQARGHVLSPRYR